MANYLFFNSGFGYGAGFMVNYNDIAGQYAGLILGIGNTFATIPGFIAPAIVGALTTKVLYNVIFFIFLKMNFKIKF